MNPLHVTIPLNVGSHCLRCNSLLAVQRHHPLGYSMYLRDMRSHVARGWQGHLFVFHRLVDESVHWSCCRKLAAQCIEDLLQLVGPSLYPRIANSWTFKFLEVRTIPPLGVIWSMKVNLIIPGCTSRDYYCNRSPPISPPWSTVAASTWFVLLTYTLLGTTNGGMGRVLQKPLLP